jgi:hypothetical protein
MIDKFNGEREPILKKSWISTLLLVALILCMVWLAMVEAAGTERNLLVCAEKK